MYKILIDSCGEFFDYMKNNSHFVSIPLTIHLGNEEIKDDENFNQADFLSKVKKSEAAPKSACPSPDDYIKHFDGTDRLYIVTLSSKLSGSYNSASLAKDIFMEEHEDSDVKIHVFDSKSASVGETLIADKIRELEENGDDFDTIIDKVNSYIGEQHTFFTLDTLETLLKSGRISHMKVLFASALNIKVVMGSTSDGMIQKYTQMRGMKKAIIKMAEIAVSLTENCKEKILAISHCNCPDTAKLLKETMQKLAKFKDIKIVETRGISSMYASDGGVILVL